MTIMTCRHWLREAGGRLASELPLASLVIEGVNELNEDKSEGTQIESGANGAGYAGDGHEYAGCYRVYFGVNGEVIEQVSEPQDNPTLGAFGLWLAVSLTPSSS